MQMKYCIVLLQMNSSTTLLLFIAIDFETQHSWTGLCFEVWCSLFLKWHKHGFVMIPQWLSQVKNPPAMQETWETQVWSLGWEDLLEGGMATHSSILAWEIPWKRIPVGYSQRTTELDMTKWLSRHTCRDFFYSMMF